MECQVLREHHGRLVSELQNAISSVSGACFSQCLISEDTYKAVLELNLTNADKARKVLLNVQQTVAVDKNMFEKFIAVIDCTECSKQLAKEMYYSKFHIAFILLSATDTNHIMV